MIKNSLLLITLLLFGLNSIGAPISRQQAQQIAAQFLSGKSSQHRAPSASEMMTEVVFNRTNAAGMPYLYAVHAGKGTGYVIVSGDDRAPAILGYMEHGSYDEDVMPENMRSWLQHYADEIELLHRYNLKTPRRSIENAGAPIAKTTTCLWDQSAPYNLECPMVTSYKDAGLTQINHEAEQAVTGCAATAIAQVLYLWKDEYAKVETRECKLTCDIPAQTDVMYQSAEKVGDETIPIWVKFSDDAISASTTIDWGNLIDVYTHRDGKKMATDEYGNVIVEGTAEQQAAVARLMHICGAAIKMNYGPAYSGGSGAMASTMLYGVYYYLGFTNARLHNQSGSEEYAGWVQDLYDELKVAKGVVFTGSSSLGGHAFVIDGYDKEDFFHVNWGWSGLADEASDNGGFYRLNSLLPTDQGIGGAVVNDGFRLQQSFISGLYPNAPAPEGEFSALSTVMLNTVQTSKEVSNGELSLYVYFSCSNNTLPELKAQVGLCMENEAGYKNIVPVGEDLFPYILADSKGYDGQYSWTGIEDGNYKLRMYFRTTLEDDAWTLCEHADKSYIRIEVNNGRAVIHNSGKYEVDVVSCDLKEKYALGEDVNFNATYEVTAGSFEMIPFVVAMPVKPDGDGGFVDDTSRGNATQMPTAPVTGKPGDEITIPVILPANQLKAGYYKVLITDLACMLPGEFYFNVTDQDTRIITTTAPADCHEGVWYDLHGRAFTDKPVRRGIYIINSKKRLIK
jgi:hypothetical protein